MMGRARQGCGFLTAAHFCLIKAKKLLFEEHAPQKVKNIHCEELGTFKR